MHGLTAFALIACAKVLFPCSPVRLQPSRNPLSRQCQHDNRASLAAHSLAELRFMQTTAVVMRLDEWRRYGQPFGK